MTVSGPARRSAAVVLSAAAQAGPASGQPGHPGPLLETLKRAAAILRRSGIPFALAGGGAAYARGAGPPVKDVDFVLLEEDVGKAATAMDADGMQVENPPEGWLIKAYDGDRVIDLIFKLADQPVSRELLDRAEELDVAATHMPVMDATDLVIAWLRVFSEHQADFAATLTCVRPLREQVDWDRVRAETADSPFAYAFLVLLGHLGGSSRVMRKAVCAAASGTRPEERHDRTDAGIPRGTD